LLGLILAGSAGLLFVRSQMIPKSFGQHSAYRADALDEIAAKPSVLPEETECLKCHVDVKQERAESLHKAVHCMHCHGVARNHVAQALKAVASPGSQIDAAQQWDGDFLTAIDLYVTKDRATCLACHEEKVGMPEDFKKINVAAHLEEMGAEEPSRREVCFDCHGPHDTAP
jgi:nitrate reductase cytochrome c-type subunit